jgi:hypothetical protein
LHGSGRNLIQGTNPILRKQLRRTRTTLSQVRRCHGRDSNRAAPEYDCRVLPPYVPAQSITQFTWLSCKLSISLVCKRPLLLNFVFDHRLYRCKRIFMLDVWMCSRPASVCVTYHVNRRTECGCEAGDTLHTNASQAVRILTPRNTR